MASFTEIASRFFRLVLGKYKNGVGLNSIVLFDAISTGFSDLSKPTRRTTWISCS